ncbi:hypothetical protein WJX72_000843 [[Myrmecia] bisecta]|uniref:Uncharacterized protein n=1 Tax=[Myrmecia] bisecta TaxID=41462 RepID=A0AAW1R512_9CHLO
MPPDHERKQSAGRGTLRNARPRSQQEDDLVHGLPAVDGVKGGPTRKSGKGGWSSEEDEILRRAVHFHGGRNWKRIAEYFKDRTDVQCLHRWQKVLNPELVKGPWTVEEDNKIIELVGKIGAKRWSLIAQDLPGRIGKQCRERWHNHLNPDIKRGSWTKEEDAILSPVKGLCRHEAANARQHPSAQMQALAHAPSVRALQSASVKAPQSRKRLLPPVSRQTLPHSLVAQAAMQRAKSSSLGGGTPQLLYAYADGQGAEPLDDDSQLRLQSAAKTFGHTPSIFRPRLSNPLQKRSGELRQREDGLADAAEPAAGADAAIFTPTSSAKRRAANVDSANMEAALDGLVRPFLSPLHQPSPLRSLDSGIPVGEAPAGVAFGLQGNQHKHLLPVSPAEGLVEHLHSLQGGQHAAVPAHAEAVVREDAVPEMLNNLQSPGRVVGTLVVHDTAEDGVAGETKLFAPLAVRLNSLASTVGAALPAADISAELNGAYGQLVRYLTQTDAPDGPDSLALLRSVGAQGAALYSQAQALAAKAESNKAAGDAAEAAAAQQAATSAAAFHPHRETSPTGSKENDASGSLPPTCNNSPIVPGSPHFVAQGAEAPAADLAEHGRKLAATCPAASPNEPSLNNVIAALDAKAWDSLPGSVVAPDSKCGLVDGLAARPCPTVAVAGASAGRSTTSAISGGDDLFSPSQFLLKECR